MTSKELINQTKQLMAIRSTADNPQALKEAVEFLVKQIGPLPGITIERFNNDNKPSILAYRGTVRPKKFDILLNAHVDVVPGNDELFTPVEKDGKLYGRGALDMKGTAVVLTDVFCELVNDVHYTLGLQIVTDEEIGGYSGVRAQIDDGVRAEFVIMGEYSNDRNTIYNAARGLCWAEIAFKGKSAHGGHLWNGTNAVVKAGEFAAAVLKRYPTPDREAWTTTASIANLSTPNDTYNKVPDSAVLKIDFRFTQEDPVFQSRESLEAFITSVDPEAELINLATFEPAVNVEELNPYVQGLSAALRKVTGKKPKFLGRPAGSDGRHYALINNDIIEFGLYGQGSHSDAEYVELSSFDEYRETMRAFLRLPVPERLRKAAEPKEALHMELLRKLVSMPTVNGDLTPINNALGFVEEFLRARGMHVDRYEHDGARSIYATIKPGNTTPAVLLNAHIDVVPAAKEKFVLTVKGDKLLGRGVMDMKFSIASYLALVDALKSDLHAYDFAILITSDEEVGGKRGVGTLLQELNLKPSVAIVPDGGENWQAETFAKGVLWVKVAATGKAAHASRPWEGESAIRRLLNALREIELLVPPEPSPEETTLSVGTIQGGTTPNQIASDASAMLDIRTGSVAQHKEMMPRIQAICKKHGVTATLLAGDPPCVNDPESPYIKPFVELVTKITGKAHDTCYSFGATDGRYFSAAGVPCIIMEPTAGGRHKDDEWLSKKGFDQYCIILAQYIQKIAAHTATPDTPKQNDIRYLAESLNATGKPAYVWYATYASGLSKENFMTYIAGGTPAGAHRNYKGCRDVTPPEQDAFISLPYELYFAGESKVWEGGLATLDTTRTNNARTISHAYLITVEQLEDIAAQENWHDSPLRLPLAKAMQQGHATIEGASQSRYGAYNELMYCGERDGYPILTITALRPRLPYRPPSAAYTRVLCKGLAENTQMSVEAVVEYIASRPGIAGHYKKEAVADIYDKAATSKPTPATGDQTHKATYVWYANYGGGLSYENFKHALKGGQPKGATVTYAGCRDKTLPRENHFISLPHRLYFAGKSTVWEGGGLGTLDLKTEPKARTIARIYLVRLDQLEDMAAQENLETAPLHLPIAEAEKNGHTKLATKSNLYNELLFCGYRDGYPILALTSDRSDQPYTPPSDAYTHCVLKGLSEDKTIDQAAAQEYLKSNQSQNS
jgi:succinyl-diaminopimelate desuccinylase